MQTGWDQQTVNETEDARTHCARRHDPLATRMDSMLHRWPNVAKDGGEDQTEKARRNRHKTFTAEEAQEVRKFDTCPTVVHGATHRASNDTCQHTHVDFRIDGYHRFREDEVTDSPCQCRGTRAVFDQLDATPMAKISASCQNCAACPGNKRHVKKIGLPESQQQCCNR